MMKHEAFGQINAMSGVVKLIDIINIIHKIDNFKEETLDKLNKCDDYNIQDGYGKLIPLDEIYIDLSYQRKLKLQEVINRLIEDSGFNKMAAGHVDLARRPDGRPFCWDGFHRLIKAGVIGTITKVPYSEYTHKKGTTEKKARELEANLFEIRNGRSAKVTAGALFKSQVVGNRPKALKTLSVMETCKLNIEGVNKDTDAYDLGGFAFFLKHYENYTVSKLEAASLIIRDIWKDKKTMSVTLLIGLAHYLTANEKPITKVLGELNIRKKLIEIVGTGKDKKNQQYFLQPMLKGKTAESVSYNLVDKGLSDLYNDKGADVKSFFTQIGLEDDEIDALERE